MASSKHNNKLSSNTMRISCEHELHFLYIHYVMYTRMPATTIMLCSYTEEFDDAGIPRPPYVGKACTLLNVEELSFSGYLITVYKNGSVPNNTHNRSNRYFSIFFCFFKSYQWIGSTTDHDLHTYQLYF